MIFLSAMSDAVNAALEALLYGAGSWLSLLLILGIMVAILVKWEYTSAFLMPAAVFMAITYWDKSLFWQGILLMLFAVFQLFYLIQTVRTR